MEIKYLASDWLQNQDNLVKAMDSTYREFFGEDFKEAVEADVETFEGIDFAPEPVLIEDIVTDRAGQYMCKEFIDILGNEEAKKYAGEDGEFLTIHIADDLMEEVNEVLWASEFYKEWLKEHPGVQCYVGYWDGGIGVLMDVYL